MNFDIVIIGGGLVGASLAAALRQSGLSLALVESQHSPALPDVSAPSPQSSPACGGGGKRENPLVDEWDARIYALSPGSRDFLEQSGAWQLLDARRIAPVEAMRVYGDTGAELEFSAYQMGVAELACILEGRALQHALWQRMLQQDNLTLISAAQCAALEFHSDAATLTLGNGSSLTARLIVGADGRDSWVRAQAGLFATPHDYRQHGVVANFRTGKPHRNIAYQWFQPDGILALLPLPGNRTSMVWSVSAEKSAELLALPHSELANRVTVAAQHTLGELEVVTAPASFPLRMLTLPHITAPRLALIGDAAHNMHPLAGQGVNTGFRDARQLADILLARGAQSDCGDAQLLRRYERKRKEDIYAMQATTFGLKHLFNNDVALLKTARNFGLGAVERLLPLKKMLMQHALH